MKGNTLRVLALGCALLCALGLFAACGAPAPSGMYAPEDAETYKTGVENVIFSVPEGYTVTMSSNMLAAVRGETSFSLQCRHSNFVYGDLLKNYEELKRTLTGLYGAYDETLREETTAAGQKALEVRYDLTVAGAPTHYTQSFFYAPAQGALDGQRLMLFTYACPQGRQDEELYQTVLETLSLEKNGYTPPEGFLAVENAAASSLVSDRYTLYCPDEWVFDASLGRVAMRVPSSTILTNLVFSEIETGEDFQAFASAYASENAPELDLSEADALETYIVAATGAIMASFRDVTLQTIDTGETAKEKITGEDLVRRREEYLQTYTGQTGLLFTFVEFTASMPDHTAQDDAQSVENDEIPYATYRFRQYYLQNDGYLYLFTYTAQEDRFEQQLDEIVKVIRYFELKEEG